VQGLRAVAVLLVVLYHAGFSGLPGGYVGVDVFFVISGFVITGLLLRERTSSGGTSLLAFYARRCRRIIPAATIVIVATVVIAYAVLGVVYGDQASIDARWTSVFLANFHFAATGTNYLSAQQPPSPLLNFWSLAVEEQFYLVYPTVFLIIAAIRIRMSLAMRLTIGLIIIIVASFVVSVVQTSSNPTVAYFSPLTRAWELALGALVAVGTPWLLTVPKRIGALATWIGLVAIGVGAVVFNAHTAYPGSLVAIPVLGATLIIAGGVTAPQWGVEFLLRTAPFQWLGNLSYSLYLWHWPLLIIAAEAAGQSSLPFRRNLWWLLVALAASVVTYYLIENPVRRASFRSLGRYAPIGLGAVLIAVSLGVSTIEIHSHEGPAVAAPAPVAAHSPGSGSNQSITSYLHQNVAESEAQVQRLVRRAPLIRSVPADLTPTLADAPYDFGRPNGSCWPSLGQSSIPSCEAGNLRSTKTMVVYGDSHAGMWFDSLSLIADLSGWKLVYLGKGDCPANDLPYENPPGWGTAGQEYTPCDQWHRFAVNRINSIHPNLVIVTEEFRPKPDGKEYTPKQWRQGLEHTFSELHVAPSDIVVLGNIPTLPEAGPQCLSRNANDVQACSAPLAGYLVLYNRSESNAANDYGSRYISVIPWLCSTTCTAIIGKYGVYVDDYHLTRTYSMYLAGVLLQSLQLNNTS
jgi:peptidoglycan/LPS O-acetylase OafA/YrhL